MNIAFDWYMKYGMQEVDARTRRNVLDASFIAHAKTCAIAEEVEYIDECVKFQESRKAVKHHVSNE